MGNYRNFKTVIYIPAGVAAGLTREKLESDYGFISRYMKIDKVYLETFRYITVPRDQYLMVKEFLEDKGVEVAGGITYVYHSDVPDGRDRLFDTMCYTDRDMRDRVRKVAEYTAGLVDEIILDDFFFTNCTCPSCIAAKGGRSWPEFRKALMCDVSENLVIGPARNVNPNVRITIKYPNWRESFYRTGYVPGEERKLFDMIYTGTETRSPSFTDQRLPEYLSYSLMRWIENVWPEHNGGGWLDTYGCWSTDRYLEQVYLTAFARPREIMFFNWFDLVDNRFTCPLGFVLDDLDRILSEVGAPVGVPAYIPIDSHGEDHVEMRLGMLGIPIEMTPVFPEDSDLILLTEASLCDRNVMGRLKEYVEGGGTCVVTSGFVANADPVLWDELSEVTVTGRRIGVTRYMNTDSDSGFIGNRVPVLFPGISHANNASWALVNGGDGDWHCPLFIKSPYGKGRIFVLAIPDNPQDLQKIPPEVFDPVKRKMNIGGLFVTAEDTSMFQYDDGRIVLLRYVKGNIHPVKAVVHSLRKAWCLKDTKTGKEYFFEVRNVMSGLERMEEYITEVTLEPGIPAVYEVCSE